MRTGQFISAVVCTKDRPHQLSAAVRALDRQTLDADRFEVIIVDHGSSGETAAVAIGLCAERDGFHYVRADRSGRAVARNSGVRASRGGIVSFTDDYAEPAPDWLERILARFDDDPDRVGVVGGDVTPVWETQRPGWLTDALLRPLSAGLNWGREARSLRPDEWLADVNCAYDKAVLARAGGFPEHLDGGGEAISSGEGLVNSLIQRLGYELVYDPQLLVRHHIPASRCTRSWFRRRSFWQGVSMNRFHRYVADISAELALIQTPEPGHPTWEEVTVPTSAAAWAELFSDDSAADLQAQLKQIEDIGYLLESQSVVGG
jgi:glycosyltransferase involved in cell wall biosynthesis